jgi:vitamin B12 transporter
VLAVAAAHAPARADDAGAPQQVVAVTALREPALVTETVAEVTVLSRSDLDKATGLTLTEVLARQPGLQAARYGGPGQASELFIRGLEARHTVLLVDGARVGSATLGEPSLDNLPVALIDHIEIVRGPLSSLYGSDAAGGVVQVFTRHGPGSAVAGELTLGSLGAVQARAGLRAGGDGFDLALDAQHSGTRGFSATNPHVPYGIYDPDRDGFAQDAFDLRGGWQIARDWRLEALALDSSGLVHFDDGPGTDSRALLVDRILSLRLDARLGEDWRMGWSAARTTDDYDTLASANPYTLTGTIGTVQQQLAWDTRVATPIGSLMGLLEATSEQVEQPGTPFAVDQRDIYAAALALDGRARGVVWQASVRRDHNSQFGDPTTGAAALAWELDPSWRLGASWGTSFVAPSFNQLYYPGYGNPALQPERGRSGEISVRWTAGEDQLRASFYRSRIRGFIASGAQPYNVPEARVDGLTLAGEGHWRALVVQGSIDLLDPRTAAPDGSGRTLLLPRRARESLSADIAWSLDAGLVGGAVTAASQRYDDAPNTIVLPSYATFDLYGEYRLGDGWSLGVRADNVTAKVYETAYGYNQPGRAFYATVRYAPR